jgi:ABC-type branched-subunit amino acid transport system ATPase component
LTATLSDQINGSDAGLEVADLSVAYGGTLAVNAVSLSAPLGRITGLIGPNGAGKTTIFNACDGLLRPSAGTVRLFGRDVTRRGTAARARVGLGRTFQRVEVCNAMSVATNVALGREARVVGANPLRQVIATSAQVRDIAAHTAAALQVCEITHLADQRVAGLSTGQRRLVELARVLAGGFPILLLDEPSSGLDEAETDRFGAVLALAVAERRVGILLVEHDMGLVMELCDYVYVVDFGRLIFEGTTAQARASNVVRAAYLGDDAGLATRP